MDNKVEKKTVGYQEYHPRNPVGERNHPACGIHPVKIITASKHPGLWDYHSDIRHNDRCDNMAVLDNNNLY
ncbi:hypothetical protein [Klebsiella variicola]|uniref:hypothetical protein n=1 Tax=Klebsiella variicola TaxID=244366 RepID=UPI001E31E316|nr:hypothetical protein [Klebsiella variicola]HCT4439333.1 hypothetical protein [Klebsiella aerogenes]